MGLKICARMTAKKQNYSFWVVMHLYITWYGYVRYYVLNWIKYKTAHVFVIHILLKIMIGSAVYRMISNSWFWTMANNTKVRRIINITSPEKPFICVSIFVCFIVFNSVSSYKIILHFYSNFSFLLHFETHI